MKNNFTNYSLSISNGLKRTFLMFALLGWCITASAQYCIPGGSFSACALTNNFYINSVSFTGTGSTFNYTNGACVANAPYYLNTGYQGDVVAGNTYTLTVTRPGNRYLVYWNVWVDWDNNEVLSDGTPYDEHILNNISGSNFGAYSASTTVTIPAGVAPGVHRMRVRVQYNNSTNNPCNASTNFNNQTESKDFYLNVVGGCTPPTVSANTTASNVCAGQQVTLTGSGASTYAWTGGVANGVAFVPSSTQTYTVTGTDSVGCPAKSTVTVSVTPLPSVSGTATPMAVCAGDSITLSGSGAGSYSWSGGVNNGVKFLPVATATYTVTGTTNGCSNTAIINVPVNPYPLVVANASKPAVCVGDTVTLSGSGATLYTWTGGVTNGVAFSPAGTITYTVTGTLNGCSATASTTIPVNPIPAINLGSDVSVCQGDSTQLSISGDPVNSTYSWTPSTGLSCNNCDNPYAKPASDISYIAIVTDALGCKGTDTVMVNITSLSVAAGNDTTLCFGSTAELYAAGGTDYLWIPVNYLSDPTVANPTVTGLVATTYTVIVSSGACSNTATVDIAILPQVPVPFIYVDGDSLRCTTDPSYISYQWYADTTLIASGTGPAIHLSHSGNYNVQVANGANCKTATGINVVLNVADLNGRHSLSVYPNPAENKLTVAGLTSAATEMNIYNMMGEACYSANGSNLKSEIDISTLPSGVYFLTLTSENLTSTKRFVKK